MATAKKGKMIAQSYVRDSLKWATGAKTTAELCKDWGCKSASSVYVTLAKALAQDYVKRTNAS